MGNDSCCLLEDQRSCGSGTKNQRSGLALTSESRPWPDVFKSEIINRMWPALSPDGQTLAIGCTHKRIQLWNIESMSRESTPIGLDGDILSLALSPDGKELASSDSGDNVRLWNVENHGQLMTLETRDDPAWNVRELKFSADGSTLTGIAGSARAPVEIVLWSIRGESPPE